MAKIKQTFMEETGVAVRMENIKQLQLILKEVKRANKVVGKADAYNYALKIKSAATFDKMARNLNSLTMLLDMCIDACGYVRVELADILKAQKMADLAEKRRVRQQINKTYYKKKTAK